MTTLTKPAFWAHPDEQAAYRQAQLEVGNRWMNELAALIDIKASIKFRSDRFVNSNFGMRI